MPNRLTELEFDEVSLCEVGKNKGAKIQIAKAKEVNDMTKEHILENLEKMAAAEPGDTSAERFENLMKDRVAQMLYVDAFRQPGRVEVVKGDVPDFDARAREIVEKDGGSRADAFVKAVERDPDGYVRYLKSRGCPTALGR